MTELYERAIQEEVAQWRGVTVEFGQRSKHRSATLKLADKSRFVIFPDSPSDSQRGHLNCISDVRKQLHELGAQRLPKKPANSKRGAYRKSAPRPERLIDIPRAPVKANPFEALASLIPPERPKPQGALARILAAVRKWWVA